MLFATKQTSPLSVSLYAFGQPLRVRFARSEHFFLFPIESSLEKGNGEKRFLLRKVFPRNNFYFKFISYGSVPFAGYFPSRTSKVQSTQSGESPPIITRGKWSVRSSKTVAVPK